MKKKALIIGLSSQDGYFLSKLLVKKNFEVLIGKYKATVSKEKSLFRPI